MKIINAGYEILTPFEGNSMMKHLELVARTCYKSEDNITDNSYEKMCKMLIDRGHEAMIEHASITVKFICDRGVSHEIVRHRLASFAQESTRYCNYSKDKFNNEITVIKPCFWDEGSFNYLRWLTSCEESERAYFSLINNGATPQEARSVLTNSLKTEIVMTTNPREWRHFFDLRCDINAHPQMREIAIPLANDFHKNSPILFKHYEF